MTVGFSLVKETEYRKSSVAKEKRNQSAKEKLIPLNVNIFFQFLKLVLNNRQKNRLEKEEEAILRKKCITKRKHEKKILVRRIGNCLGSVLTKICMRMLVVALLTTAQIWKQSRGPPTGEQINKLCYIHTMEYCSAIQRNE